MTDQTPIGEQMYGWATDLFPIMRSLTGPGVRQTLDYLKELLPGLETRSVPTGTRVFDWVVPDEWTFRAAYIEDEQGNRIIDAARCNLHVVNYSEPVDKWIYLSELQEYLYSQPDTPDVIPYVTSYYKRRWGFCLSQKQRDALLPGRYHVVIDADLKPGVMNFGELILPGRDQTEVLISTYVCHPSMANNELSGPVLATALARWLSGLDRKHTYRILFLVETLGAIAYLSEHWRQMKANTIAGFVLSCVGDDRCYSFLPSRKGNTLADRAARHALTHHAGQYKEYHFLKRGSDERQYCTPPIDLPVALMMRSKFGDYPEYHTSADDLSMISPQGLEGSFRLYTKCLTILEGNSYFRATLPCEPQMGRRGLYPTISTRDSYLEVQDMVDVLAYADGTMDLIDLAEAIGHDAEAVLRIAAPLIREGLLALSDKPCPANME